MNEHNILICMIAVIAGCNDDMITPRADASACSCPASELPIKPRIKKHIGTVTVPALDPPGSDGRAGMGALCPPGSFVMTGGCIARDGQRTDVVLEQSYAVIANDSGGWQCDWKNLGTVPFSATAVAYCLMPE